MLHRIIAAGGMLSRKTADQSAAVATSLVRATLGGIMTLAHHSLMVMGVAAIAALTLMFVKPHFTEHLKALSPFAAGTAVSDGTDVVADISSSSAPMDTPGQPIAIATSGTPAKLKQPAKIDLAIRKASLSDEQMVVSQWISRRYRVAADATHMLVSEAYKNAQKLELDPLLILAVAAIESGFNPFAESAVGAQGLMQVMSKVHRDKFREHGGVHAALDPVTNIKVGSAILKDYVRQGGSVEAGLKRYVGAAAFATDSGYGTRVLAEYRRLQEVAGRTAPVVSTVASSAEPAMPARPAGEAKKPAPEDKSAALKPIDRIDAGAVKMAAI
ncbi:transglycosylase SLT domain-containing protein [Janthinobacterium sp. 17J80-10]|uniref:transglycosylase SLT domain-containing protein n=1 Tax=Janthinobacterium sp. 17J80-10 TaxID=2497863 RepID=UPI0010059ED5|nr:transglycosylase SLT domain-containing protein [Janthinobacterium sp. 17J80-10]QAU35228.1 hypothetical protein EKL02_14160 [Janthinobacterium sp. 17J80-10]